MACLMCKGNSFHTFWAAPEKAQSPQSFLLVLGTTKSECDGEPGRRRSNRYDTVGAGGNAETKLTPRLDLCAPFLFGGVGIS